MSWNARRQEKDCLWRGLESLEQRLLLDGADLQAQILKPKLPKASPTISGDGSAIVLPVQVTNAGSQGTPAGANFDISVWARPSGASDGSSDVQLDLVRGSLDALPIPGLKPGKSKQYTAVVRLPAGLATGNYALVAKVDSGGDIAETSETNNEAQTGPLVVQEGFFDLAASIGRVTLPAAVVNHTSLKGSVEVNVANLGNLTLPANQRVTVTLIAQRKDSSGDIVLASGVQSISRLGAGKQRALRMLLNLPDGLPEGEYNLLAVATASPDFALPEPDANNVAMASSGIVSAPPFVDLVTDLQAVILKRPALAGDSGSVTVTVGNAGNVAAKGPIRLNLLASKDKAVGDDMPLTDLDFTVSLQPGQSRSFKITFNLPTALDSDSYFLMAQVESAGPLVEAASARDNNTEFSARDNNTEFSNEEYYVQGLLSAVEWANFYRQGYWDYGFVSGRASSSAKVTASPEAISGLLGTRTRTEAGNTLTQALWLRTPGVADYLTGWSLGGGDGSGVGDFNLSMKGDGLQVSPLAMQLGKVYRAQESMEGTWKILLNGIEVAADVTQGSGTVVTKLLDYESLTLPDGTQTAAAQVSLVLSFTGLLSFNYDGRTYTGKFSITQTQVFWAAPNVGILSSVNNTKLSASMGGLGAVSKAVAGRLQLRDWAA